MGQVATRSGGMGAYHFDCEVSLSLKLANTVDCFDRYARRT